MTTFRIVWQMKTSKPLSIQPIPYQGSKRALAPQIADLFPARVQTLYEPFAGSAALTLYAASIDLAEHYVISDVYAPLIQLWERIIESPEVVAAEYERIWSGQFDNIHHFNEVRASFNTTGDPVALLYLVARCVKNAVRFNKSGHFTQSADKRRTGMKPDKVMRNCCAASLLLRGRSTVKVADFADAIAPASSDDLVYMDPPYQGTTYGRDKRYAAQLEKEKLVAVLEEMEAKQIPYVLSYDGRTGEKVYGERLPVSIGAEYVELEAGRSSQSTLAGRNEITYEGLYISSLLSGRKNDSRPIAVQSALFG